MQQESETQNLNWSINLDFEYVIIKSSTWILQQVNLFHYDNGLDSESKLKSILLIDILEQYLRSTGGG